MKKFALLAAVAAVSVTACKKDDNNPSQPSQSKSDLLMAKSWRITAETSTSVSNGQTTTTDEFALLDACEKDDFYKFQANKVFVEDEGATRCDQNDPQTSNGTWELNSDQTKLTLTTAGLGGIIPYDIVELTGSTLKLRLTITNGSDSYTQNVTYTSF